MSDKVSLIVDGAGRYVLGVITAYGKEHLTVKNPALIIVNAGPDGKIQIQTIPFFFKELTNGNDDTVWEFSRNNCAIATEINLSEQIINQYYNAVQPKQIQQTQTQQKIVKLFDE